MEVEDDCFLFGEFAYFLGSFLEVAFSKSSLKSPSAPATLHLNTAFAQALKAAEEIPSASKS